MASARPTLGVRRRRVEAGTRERRLTSGGALCPDARGRNPTHTPRPPDQRAHGHVLLWVPRFARLAAWTVTLGLLAPPAVAKPFDGKLAQDGLGIEVAALVMAGKTELASNNSG